MTKKLRFSDAALAIESTPKALRKMLQNPTLVVPKPPQDGWSEFSQVHIAVFAVARRLIEFGFSVAGASSAGCFVVFTALPEAGAFERRPLNSGEFLGVLSDHYLKVVMNEGVPRWEVIVSPHWPLLGVEDQARATLILPIKAIVQRAFERAGVSAADDMTGIDEQIVDALFRLPIQYATARAGGLLAELSSENSENRKVELGKRGSRGGDQ